MDKKYEDINLALKDYLKALGKLQRLGVTPNKKDFTSQVGEWLVGELYDGKRASNSTQKHWDIQVAKKIFKLKLTLKLQLIKIVGHRSTIQPMRKLMN